MFPLTSTSTASLHFVATFPILHNLAVDKPLILTEFGIDSIREGKEFQAETLGWQVHAGFEMGLAGAVIFAWTDDWYAFHSPVKAAFRLTIGHLDWWTVSDRRNPPFMPFSRSYGAPLPPALPESPKVSVVVCAYNAERTMEPCLASLEKLNYPNYEVIVVNDGSTDRTREISEGFSYIRLDQSGK